MVPSVGALPAVCQFVTLGEKPFSSQSKCPFLRKEYAKSRIRLQCSIAGKRETRSAPLVRSVGSAGNSKVEVTQLALEPLQLDMEDAKAGRRKFAVTGAAVIGALYIAATAPLVAVAAAAPLGTEEALAESIYNGEYTDPINHPGGTRQIVVNSDNSVIVTGGGGRGEPASFTLSGKIVGTKIFVDFSPKGGPKDFEGEFAQLSDGRQGIVWYKKSNFWPKSHMEDAYSYC
ncbi:hypothetical protein CYMTET_16547 [Cymbomonas tetramitiformis]|uniref:Uncharacterized protein n=1 Tax=Cymbomonas tetramitiformis TaxID=36881 RepID=A0AAE0L7W6_9CHLO|nr:hypothetical protein CYMTET_16547 [Cymbomonas tetramitiformis]